MDAARTSRKLVGYLIVATIYMVSSGISAAESAWPVMLALGVCHSEWPQVPALGFWEVLVLIWALRLVTPYRMKFAEPDPQ